MVVTESETTTTPAVSYGVGVDDMVVEWREFNLIDDGEDCLSGGECAVVDLQADEFSPWSRSSGGSSSEEA